MNKKIVLLNQRHAIKRIVLAIFLLSCFSNVMACYNEKLSRKANLNNCSLSAEQGNALAQYNLGWMYKRGQFVTKDYEQSAKWFLKAAEQGHEQSQYILGAMYWEGKIITSDYKQANEQSAKWYTKSAEQGNKNAQYAIGRRYDKGQGVQQDYHH